MNDLSQVNLPRPRAAGMTEADYTTQLCEDLKECARRWSLDAEGQAHVSNWHYTWRTRIMLFWRRLVRRLRGSNV